MASTLEYWNAGSHILVRYVSRTLYVLNLVSAFSIEVGLGWILLSSLLMHSTLCYQILQAEVSQNESSEPSLLAWVSPFVRNKSLRVLMSRAQTSEIALAK